MIAILGGLFLFFINWYDALAKGKFRPGVAIWGPFTFFLGIMLIAVPYPDKSKFPKAEFAPKTWAIFIVIGSVLGFANWFLMSF